MTEEDYVVDAAGGPYYNAGEHVRKGEVLGKDENGVEVVSRINGIVRNVAFDGKSHCFNLKVIKDEKKP